MEPAGVQMIAILQYDKLKRSSPASKEDQLCCIFH